MKSNRRNFFKVAGIATAGIFSGNLTSFGSNNTGKPPSTFGSIPGVANGIHSQVFNMSGFAAPKIETVRIGIIGLGMRGPGAVERMSNIEGVEIRALCDIRPERVANARKFCQVRDCLKQKPMRERPTPGRSYALAMK